MRVAVVGGYGVFGERLCRLLARDGHEVIVCGRDSDKAAALAAEAEAPALAERWMAAAGIRNQIFNQTAAPTRPLQPGLF